MITLQPPGWRRGSGYSHGVVAAGRLVFLAGMVGWNERQELVAAHLVGQVRQALANIVALLGEAGGGAEHLVRLTWFLADRREYLGQRQELGRVYREVIGRHYPAMSVIEVSGFIESGVKVEIEATAVIPARSGDPAGL